MKKFIPTIKSVFILALAAIAVYQVNLLWLDRITNRNFFLYLQARFPPAAPDEQNAFARPYRIVSGAGDGLFEMQYGGIDDSDGWAFGETVLDAVLQNGVYKGTTSLADVLAQPVIIFEYAFAMNADKFLQALGQRGNLIFSHAGIEAFDGVAVQPRGDASRVFFIGGDVWEFSAAGDFNFTITPANAEHLHYVAADGGFVPRTDGFSYNVVTVENPFREARGIFTLPHIRNMVEPFFDDRASIIPSLGAGDVYTFSNRNTMVRYLENAVLEYTSYRTIGRTAQENFMADFSAALAFINNDPYMINEIYLRNHESRGRAHIFWFDYVIDNYPLILTEEWRTGANCEDPLYSPVEVTVEYGRVVRYRRLAYTFGTGGLQWKDSSEFIGGFTELAFPIEERDIIELAVLEVSDGMGTR